MGGCVGTPYGGARYGNYNTGYYGGGYGYNRGLNPGQIVQGATTYAAAGVGAYVGSAVAHNATRRCFN